MHKDIFAVMKFDKIIFAPTWKILYIQIIFIYHTKKVGA